MDHSQVIKYFEDYIKKYSPYSNNVVFSTIMDYLSKNYTKELYQNIPLIFKQLYEDNFITIELYDVLLKNIGIPDVVVSKLSVNEKILFFRNLTDYFKTRGNINFFDKVSKLFYFDFFDVYELYIDYDKDEQDWVFKPNLVIRNTKNELISDSLNYNSIYNKIPSYLINKAQLDSFNNQNNIILPIKSNIVLLDYTIRYRIDELIHLINATFIKEYQFNNITCYFLDEQFNVTLKTFYLLWYYILLKCYNSYFDEMKLNWIIQYLETKNTYTINDMDDLLVEYAAINDSYTSRNFYDKYISSIFRTYTYSIKYQSSDLKNLLPLDFLDYIDQRIFESTKSNNLEYNDILNEMLNSLIINVSQSNDDFFIRYSEYFINSLTRIMIDLEETSSYTLLYNFKPFHTELISSYIDRLVIDSKFDIVTPYDKRFSFLFKLNLVEVCELLDFVHQKFVMSKISVNTIIDQIWNISYDSKTTNLSITDTFNIID